MQTATQSNHPQNAKTESVTKTEARQGRNTGMWIILGSGTALAVVLLGLMAGAF